MLTHTFKLLSGVECTVKEMTGIHQRILTEQTNKKIGDNLNEMLADLIIKVGTKTSGFDVEFVNRMLSGDRRKALAEARMFSVGLPDEHGKVNFDFTWEYVDNDGNDRKLEQTVDLTAGFPETPYYRQWENYDEVEKDVLITLPSSGLNIKFTMLDGIGEYLGSKTKREERSSHTPILMRQPRIMKKTDNAVTPINMSSADLDKLSYRDIEHLRKAIKDHEGRIDTEMKFEHPEAEIKDPHEKYVIVDLLQLKAFFFPSEAI